jgi:hypothetical protein
MIAFLDSDLLAIMRGGAFSERVTFDPDGAAKPVMAIFNKPIRTGAFFAVEGPGAVSANLASRDLNVTLAKSDLPRAPQHNDIIEKDGQRYRVRRVLSDGHGLLTLGLWYADKNESNSAQTNPD